MNEEEEEEERVTVCTDIKVFQGLYFDCAFLLVFLLELDHNCSGGSEGNPAETASGRERVGLCVCGHILSLQNWTKTSGNIVCVCVCGQKQVDCVCVCVIVLFCWSFVKA